MDTLIYMNISELFHKMLITILGRTCALETKSEDRTSITMF
ncbi:hypothetical protein HanXRQr2_Chr08g0349611 [Helianthus annuus]|uniref:Uncharacterized protein n=1 Tax=Helianthus annuus TaxID=4232 RepID=A0A9K3NDN2_HELAN|nr:hypothetical protein HanXRQr2_Chr08g0349611 [Helianthus annuus]